MNWMILWSQTQPGPNRVEWTVDALAEEIYEVTAPVKGDGFNLAAPCNGQKVAAKVTNRERQRVPMGDLPLKAGKKILLEVDPVALEVKKPKKSRMTYAPVGAGKHPLKGKIMLIL